MTYKAIATHNSPDLDAITSVWLLKRFDSQRYENAQVIFINPGEKVSQIQAEELNLKPNQIIHVDTGLGTFDHHQPERVNEKKCAAFLIYEHLCQIHPVLSRDHALRELIKFVNEIDHFQEIHWPDASNLRYTFMIHELIHGFELVNQQNYEAQLRFGMDCLDYTYQVVKQTIKADQFIDQEGIHFNISAGPCIALETSNEETIKQAQKQGYVLVFRKDPKQGNVRIKVRPDSDIMLHKLYQAILEVDKVGSWYYHASGKMLLNGSLKHRNQIPSPLSVRQIIKLIKQCY